MSTVSSRFQLIFDTLYVGDESPVSFVVYNENRDAVDLSAFGAVTLTIADGRGAVVQQAMGEGAGSSGSELTADSDGTLTFTPSAATVSKKRTLQVALRQDSDGRVIAAGQFQINYAPGA